MTKSDLVRTISLASGIMQISLNQPEKLNALNHETLTKLSQIFVEIKKDNKIKAILLTGEGRGFCAGADIKQLTTINAQQGLMFSRFGQQVFRELELIGKPTLAAIHGFAFGGGCELAMAASLRIAAENTLFSQPEIKLGVIPGFGGTQRLSRLIGKGRAMDLCLTGRRIAADEALRWGLVNEVVPQDNLLNRATQILQGLTQLGPLALQSILTVIDQGYNLSLEEALELEAAHFGLCCATADKSEGVKAFLEKREAMFSGE